MQRTAIAMAALLAMAAPATADVPEKGFYIGAYLGGHLVLDDWDLTEFGNAAGVDQYQGVPGSAYEIGSGFAAGLRIGGHLNWWLGLEGALGFLPLSTDLPEDSSNFALEYSVDALFHLIRGNWVPFVDVGFGGYHNISGGLGPDVDYNIHYGIGLRGMLMDWMALRIDLRHQLTDGFDSFDTEFANNLHVNAGLDFYLMRSADDRDKDGIPDESDACPLVWGKRSAKGCPDKDGDGIRDSKDKCPSVAGHASAGGCPDKDGDTVVDGKDVCPTVKGLVEMRGCPDTDGDGIPDIDDACPKVAGPKATSGCPDQDGDGIPDKDDRCPAEAGPRGLQGCPDGDGDGIADRDDKCPKEPGVKELQGCMPDEVKQKFSGALEGIHFKTGSAKIRKKSFAILNGAAETLKKFPSVRVAIEGHTDDRGKDEMNLKLSEERAQSVKQYLVERGIKPHRMRAKGYGETRPVATNKTGKGRAMNRRIEFLVIKN